MNYVIYLGLFMHLECAKWLDLGIVRIIRAW